jgi:fucose 4-O-acetylase-like acetyltransferase
VDQDCVVVVVLVVGVPFGDGPAEKTNLAIGKSSLGILLLQFVVVAVLRGNDVRKALRSLQPFVHVSWELEDSGERYYRTPVVH